MSISVLVLLYVLSVPRPTCQASVDRESKEFDQNGSAVDVRSLLLKERFDTLFDFPVELSLSPSGADDDLLCRLRNARRGRLGGGGSEYNLRSLFGGGGNGGVDSLGSFKLGGPEFDKGGRSGDAGRCFSAFTFRGIGRCKETIPRPRISVK